MDFEIVEVTKPEGYRLQAGRFQRGKSYRYFGRLWRNDELLLQTPTNSNLDRVISAVAEEYRTRTLHN